MARRSSPNVGPPVRPRPPAAPTSDTDTATESSSVSLPFLALHKTDIATADARRSKVSQAMASPKWKQMRAADFQRGSVGAMLLFVPFDQFVEGDLFASEYIQRTVNSQCSDCFN